MSVKHSGRSSLNFMSATDHSKRTIRSPETTIESSFQIVRGGIRHTATKEKQVMQRWVAGHQDKADNNDVHEQVKHDANLSDEREVPSDAFVMRCDLPANMANETKTATDAMKTESVMITNEDTIADVTQVKNLSTEKVIKARCCACCRKLLSLLSRKGRFNTFLLGNADQLVESDCLRNPSTANGRGNALFRPMSQVVKHHNGKINDKCRPEQLVEQKAKLESFVLQNSDDELITSATRSLSEAESRSDEKSPSKHRGSFHGQSVLLSQS